MQSHQNIQSGFDDGFRRQNRCSTSHEFPSFQRNLNSDMRDIYRRSSEFDFNAEYDLQPGRLPTMRERFTFEKLRQAEKALRDFHAGHEQLPMHSSGTSPQCYDRTGGFPTHVHRNSSELLGDHLALTGRSPYSNTPSYLTQGHHDAGISYPRGSSRTGYSLGESLPRSTMRKTELARRRASTVSACCCHQSYPQQFPTRSNLCASDIPGNYGYPYASSQWRNDGMARGLRRASSGVSLPNYRCGY